MKIVIVDDEPKIRNGLSKLLSSRPGFEITGVFENAMEALEQLSVSYADVIITDIKMPEMDGLTATRRIRSLNRPDAEQIPIFAVTAGIFPGDIEKIKAAGMTAYLPKPLVWEELIAVLERYCEKADCPLQCV